MSPHADNRLLIVAPFPYAANSGQGGATVCSKALRLLQLDFDVGMVCFSSDNEVDRKACAELRLSLTYFESVQLRINKLKVLQAKLSSVLLRPEHTHYFDSQAMRDALDRALRTFQPTAVIFQFPQMAQYLPDASSPPAGQSAPHTIMDVQDAYSVSWFRRLSSTHGPLSRLYALLQWLSWIKYERKHYARASQVWTLSSQDRFGLSLYAPQLSPRVMGLPLDIPCTPSRAPARHEDNALGNPNLRVGFLGSFGHAPNVEALHFLLKEIALATASLPIEFVVAGRHPPADLVATAPANVRFLGFVESLDDFYGQCHVIIAPLLSGGGVKIKVAEALAHGKAVVTTAIGAEGLDVDNGQQLLLAQSARDFANQLARLSSTPALVSHLQTQAYEAAKAQLDGSAWLARVKQAMDAVGAPR